jgi:hypothetical protein
MNENAMKADIRSARERRNHASRVAARVSQLSAIHKVNVGTVDWDSLPSIPAWCLSTTDQQHILRKTCGAFYLAGTIKNAIDGKILRELNHFLGDQLFQYVRTEYPSVISDDTAGFTSRPEQQLTATGAAVLLNTLPEPPLIDLFRKVIGPPVSKFDQKMAVRSYNSAVAYVARTTGATSLDTALLQQANSSAQR